MGSCCRLLLVAIAILASPTAVAAQSLPRSVLILDQSDTHSAWYASFSAAFRSTLRAGSADHTSVYAEHLDFSRFSGSQYDDLLRRYLGEKYRSTPIGLLVAQGSSSLEFLLRSRGQLWPGTPIVFAGIDEETGKRLNLPLGVTGILYQRTFGNAVTSAQVLVPNLRRIALVGDAWEHQAVRRHYREEIPAFVSQFEFIDLLGLPMTEIRKRVSALPNDTAIIYTSVTRDGAGLTYVPHQGLAAFANVANRPIVLDVETNIGFGGTGGFVTTPFPLGEATARTALRILDGEEVSTIPVTTGDFTRPIFDWRELQRFGVDERNLPKDSELRFRPPTFWDQYRWLAITIAAILAVQALMISGLLIERRRRRFAEADARRHLLELTHLNRAAAVSVMSTSIAHELNQPLGAIQSYAEAARLHLKKNPPALDKVEQILASICRDDQRAADIINRIRGLLKKRDELEWREFDFNEVARDALEIVRTEGKKRGVEIDETLAGVALPVSGDRIHLQQVIINLAMNGLDAMENCVSGNRRMSVQTVLADNSILKFLVIDSGPGIPVDKLNQVFDAFYTTKRHGTGLGLSIAREIVEALGGKIWAENRPGGGAIFCFTLPLSKRASS